MISTLCSVLAVALVATPAPNTPLTKTDPKTWTKAGALGLRFGMGPGDVALIYPTLQRTRHSACRDSLPKEVQAAGGKPCPNLYLKFESEVSRVLCVVTCTFFRGRLIEISVIPPRETDAEERQFWSRRVEGILNEKYEGKEISLTESDQSVNRWSLGEGAEVRWVPGSHILYGIVEERIAAGKAFTAWLDHIDKATHRADLEKL